MMEHSERGGMHDPGCPRDRRGKVLDRDRRDGLRWEVNAHALGEVLGAGGLDVVEVEPGGATREERIGGRRTGTPAPDLHDAFERCSGQGREESVAITHPVGVVSDETVVIEYDEVDGSQVFGIRVELVDDFERQLLARVRDVHRRVTEAMRLLEEGPDILSVLAELDEIEDAVLVVETQCRRLLLVHWWREGRRDALTDQPDEIAGASRRRAWMAVPLLLRHDASGTSKSTVASDTLTGAEIRSTSACAGCRV